MRSAWRPASPGSKPARSARPRADARAGPTACTLGGCTLSACVSGCEARMHAGIPADVHVEHTAGGLCAAVLTSEVTQPCRHKACSDFAPGWRPLSCVAALQQGAPVGRGVQPGSSTLGRRLSGGLAGARAREQPRSRAQRICPLCVRLQACLLPTVSQEAHQLTALAEAAHHRLPCTPRFGPATGAAHPIHVL